MIDAGGPGGNGENGGNGLPTGEALDRELRPSASAKDYDGTLERWAEGTTAARALPGARLDIPYGEAPRQRMDLFLPPEAAGPVPVPCFAFIHGGFWQRLSKDYAAFAAPAFLARGFAFASFGYTLCPETDLTGIVAEISTAFRHMARIAPDNGIDAGRIVVGGHSAGAHLAACLLTRAGHPGEDAPTPAGLALVSGVFALGPVRRSYVNEKVGMTAEEARILSPAIHPPRADVPVALFVGEEETGEFHRQTAALANSWRPLLSALTVATLPGRDHFDILDEMATADGAILSAALGMTRAEDTP